MPPLPGIPHSSQTFLSLLLPASSTQYAEATLGSGNLRLAVALPDGEDLNEWVAVNSMFEWIDPEFQPPAQAILSPPPSPPSRSAVDFFNQINMLYGTITEFCTHDSCPVMSAGPKCVDFCHTVHNPLLSPTPDP